MAVTATDIKPSSQDKNIGHVAGPQGGGGGGFNPLSLLIPGLSTGGTGGVIAAKLGQAFIPQLIQHLLQRRGGGYGRGYGGWQGQRGGAPHVMAPVGSPWSNAPSPGFQHFLNMMYGRYGQPSAPYQGFLQALQERRDARAGVPDIPPQGAAAPSAQRHLATPTGGRSF